MTILEVLVNVKALVETNGIAKLKGYCTFTQTTCPVPLLPAGLLAVQAAFGSVVVLQVAVTVIVPESTIGTTD